MSSSGCGTERITLTQNYFKRHSSSLSVAKKVFRMSDERIRLVPVWCHTCGAQSDAVTNTDFELECLGCMSTFVEEQDQGVDRFLAEEHNQVQGSGGGIIDVPASSRNDISAETSAHPQQPSVAPAQDERSRIINHILDNLFGAPSIIAGPSPLTSAQPILNPPIRIRPAPPQMLQTGMFGLLHSVAAIRIDAQGGIEHHGGAMDNAGFEQFLHHILMNESSHAGAPPASPDMIGNLKRETITPGSDFEKLGECCISQEAFEIDDVMVTLPCGHKYKEEPIVHWLKMHCTCPVCRVNITTAS